jgi:hypothetical protein
MGLLIVANGTTIEIGRQARRQKIRQKNVRQKNKDPRAPSFIFLSYIFLPGLFSLFAASVISIGCTFKAKVVVYFKRARNQLERLAFL